MPRKNKIKIVLDKDVDAAGADGVYFYAGEAIRGCVMLRLCENGDENKDNNSNDSDSESSSTSSNRSRIRNKVMVTLVAKAGVNFSVQDQHYEKEQTLLQHTIAVEPTHCDDNADKRLYQATFAIKLPVSIPGSIDLSDFGKADPLSAIAYQLRASFLAKPQRQGQPPATTSTARILDIRPNRPAPMPILLQPHTRTKVEHVHPKRRFWHFFSRAAHNKAASRIVLQLCLPRRAFAVTEWIDTVGSYAMNHTQTRLRVDLSLLCYKQMMGMASATYNSKSQRSSSETKLAIQESKLLTATLKPGQRLDMAGCHAMPDTVVPSWRHDEACLRWTYALQLTVVTDSASGSKKGRAYSKRNGRATAASVIAKVRIPILLCAAPPHWTAKKVKTSKYPNALQNNDPWSVFKYASFRQKACPTMKNLTSHSSNSINEEEGNKWEQQREADDVDSNGDSNSEADDSSASASSNSSSEDESEHDASSSSSGNNSSSTNRELSSSGSGDQDDSEETTAGSLSPVVVVDDVPRKGTEENLVDQHLKQEVDELKNEQETGLKEMPEHVEFVGDEMEEVLEASYEEIEIEDDLSWNDSSEKDIKGDKTDSETVKMEEQCNNNRYAGDVDAHDVDQEESGDEGESCEHDDLHSLEDDDYDDESVWLDTTDVALQRETAQPEQEKHPLNGGILQPHQSDDSNGEFEVEESSQSSHEVDCKENNSEPATESLSSLDELNEPDDNSEWEDKDQEELHSESIDATTSKNDEPEPAFLLGGAEESSEDDDYAIAQDVLVDDMLSAAKLGRQEKRNRGKKADMKTKKNKSGSSIDLTEDNDMKTSAKKKKKTSKSHSDLEEGKVEETKPKKKKKKKKGSDEEEAKETKSDKQAKKKRSTKADSSQLDDLLAAKRDSGGKASDAESVRTKEKKPAKLKAAKPSTSPSSIASGDKRSDSDSEEEDVIMQVTKRKAPSKTISANLDHHHVTIEDRYLAAVDCFRRKPSKPPTDEDIYKLSTIVRAVTFEKGETIIDNEQEQEACIFFLRRGKAETLQQGRFALMFLAGTHLGEEVFLDAKRKRKTTGKARDKITAATKVVCGAVRIRDYFEVFGDEYEETARS